MLTDGCGRKPASALHSGRRKRLLGGGAFNQAASRGSVEDSYDGLPVFEENWGDDRLDLELSIPVTFP